MADNMEFLGLSSYELPVIESNFKRYKWVQYGKDNLFPKEMVDYLSYSAIHKGIVDLKKTLIAGNGFVNENGESVELNLNSKLSDFETLKRVARDYSIYNGFALQILWARNGKEIAEIRHIDFSKIRAEWDEYDSPDNYYYCRDWKYYSLPRNKPVLIPRFNPDTVVRNGAIIQPKQLYYFYEPEPSIPYYPIPSYSPAFKDIEFDYQYGLFKANSMKNGMFPSLHVEVAGNPPEEKKKQFRKQIKENWQGSDKAGGVLVTYGGQGDGAINLTPIQADAGADKFIAWKEDSNQNIISAHGLTSRTLAGLEGGAGIQGQGNEMVVALEQFQNGYVDEKQDYIIEVFDKLLKFTDKQVEGLDISDKRPFTIVPDILWDIMTSKDIIKVASEKYGIELDGTSIPDNNGEV